jgi:trehalose utilization protein
MNREEFYERAERLADTWREAWINEFGWVIVPDNPMAEGLSEQFWPMARAMVAETMQMLEEAAA